MNAADKTLLDHKKRQLQINIAVTNWLPWWLPVLEALKELKLPWRFEYFECAKATELIYWEMNLQKAPLAGLGISLADIRTPDDYAVQSKLYDHYPSVRLLRYLPALTHQMKYRDQVSVILDLATKTLDIKPEEEVYLFFNQYSPVLILPFSSIRSLPLDDMMEMQDMSIMALDYSWLIFRSLEYEWTWGKHTNH